MEVKHIVYLVLTGYLLINSSLIGREIWRLKVYEKPLVITIVILTVGMGLVIFVTPIVAEEWGHYVIGILVYWLLLQPFASSGMAKNYYIDKQSLRVSMLTFKVKKHFFEDANDIRMKESEDDFDITFVYDDHSRTLHFENKKQKKY